MKRFLFLSAAVAAVAITLWNSAPAIRCPGRLPHGAAL